MPPERLNLAAYTLALAARRPDKEAVVFLGPDGKRRALSYRQLTAAVIHGREALRRAGLPPGARAAIRLTHSLDFAIMFLACAAGGYTAVPLSPELTAEEVDFILKDADVSLVIRDMALPCPALNDCIELDVRQLTFAADAAFELDPAQAHFHDTSAEDAAFIVYTSGTSGFPKGVVHAHRVVTGREPMFEGWSGITESDRVLHPGALNWTYTMGVGFLDPLWRGATSILSYTGRNAVEWPAIIESEGVTIFASVPGLYRKILKYADLKAHPMPTLRHCLTAGAPLSAHMYNAWKEQTSRELYEALGMSEISTYISSGPRVPVKPGSPGKAQEGRKIAVLPVDSTSGNNEPLPQGTTGLLAVHKSDPGLMLGYLHNALDNTSFRGDWFTGGDLAHIDEQGYVHFHGRNDETMNSFGYRVSPLEVERALSHHPAVLDAAVAEIPIAGEGDLTIIQAFVVPKDESILLESSRALDLAHAILDYASLHLAHYKLPRTVTFVRDLPRNPNGKLVRKRLHESLTSQKEDGSLPRNG